MERALAQRLREQAHYLPQAHPGIEEDTAAYLQSLVVEQKALRVLEIGTGLGFSGIHLAEALRETGGKLWTVEKDEELFWLAKENFSLGGFEDIVEIFCGDIKDILPHFRGPFDLILQDGAKGDYLELLPQLLSLLSPEGVLVTDDTMLYLTNPYANVRDKIARYNLYLRQLPEWETRILPLGDGLSVTKKGGVAVRSFYDISKIKLDQWPTPIQKLSRWGEIIGLRHLYCKRDDISLLGFGGNKLRKLEYWLAEALDEVADEIIVAGDLQSNMVRLTAAACAKAGLPCLAVHNSDEPAKYQGNLLLDKLFGAKQVFLGKVNEVERGQAVARMMEEKRSAGGRPYYINEEPVGNLGYINCLLEIDQSGLDFDDLIIVGAMGITASGFIYANKMLGNKYRIHCISVEFNRETLLDIFSERIGFIEKFLEDEELPQLTDELLLSRYNTVIYTDYMGEGWGKTTPESLETIVEVARAEGFFIDHVYNAKVFTGVKGLADRGILAPESRVCVVHTGGGPTAFGYADLYQEISG